MSVVVVALVSVLAGQPSGWSCDAERFADGVCDCGCAVNDIDDCASDEAAACDIDHCGDLGPPLADDNSRCDGAQVLESQEPLVTSCSTATGMGSVLTVSCALALLGGCRRRRTR